MTFSRKRLKPLLTTTLLCGVLVSLPTQAEFKNSSYSYLGMGIEQVNYSETSDDFGGLKFESTFDGSNLVQKSGGYTAVGDNFGFFLATSSTLLANENTEEWDFPAIGVVQEDQMTVKRTAIDILGTYHLQNGHFINFGSRYNSVSFSRFDFSNTDFTDRLNDAIFATDAFSDANLQAELDALVTAANNNGVCVMDSQERCIGTFRNGVNDVTLDEFKEAKEFNPAATAGVVFEDMTSWSGVIGWGYDSYFIRQNKGWRYQFAARIGFAVYESVLNTQNDRSLTRSFGGDWEAHVLAGIGYQFQPEFGVIASLEYNAIHREAIESGNVQLPVNDFHAFSPQVAANWAF